MTLLMEAINLNSVHMISLLRRTSISVLSSVKSCQAHLLSSSVSYSLIRIAIMDSRDFWPSRRLLTLAQQLRFYRPPPEDDHDEEEQRMKDSVGKVVSQVGFAESVTSVAQQPAQRFTPKRAAVLVCLFEGDDGEFRVILTKRSSRLSTHSGEVSLPGGKAEETDASDAETATREAKEEIGLDPSLLNVVTCLEPFLSKHLLRVIPVIGILPDKNDFNPSPNAAEVEAIFDNPLEMFLKDENRKWEKREWMGVEYLLHFFDYEMSGKKSAAILIRAASVVYQKPPAFLEQSLKYKVPSAVLKDTTMT